MELTTAIQPAAADSVHGGIAYLSGFGNHFASEAMAGALPVEQNSPQRPPLGLIAEQLSGTAFTVPRRDNLRSWLYRVRPAASHGPLRRRSDGQLRTAPHHESEPSPNRMRWNAQPIPVAPTDFLDGLMTFAANGDAGARTGAAVHLYCANRSMTERVFHDADGDLLIVPQMGRLLLFTEMGRIGISPGEIAVVPRGIRFRVDLPDGPARGYVCENYGAPFRLPDLGPIGANGLANPRDFMAPTAAYEDPDRPTELVAKFGGHLWSAMIDHSPLDVVAWHGNYVPYKYDLARFNTIGTVSFDHPDPSIYTVLTSPSDSPGTANIDFVIFPPRWLVAEHTFRPPWFHRNVMSEFMGLIHGVYDGKATGFVPGGASLHNCMTGHGPDRQTFATASAAALAPAKIADTLAFMFETRMALCPTRLALDSPTLQPDYDASWSGFPNSFAG